MVCKRLRLIALCVTTLTSASGMTAELPKTQADFYALGEQLGQCAAFFTFLSRESMKHGNPDNAQELAERRTNWRLGSVMLLGFGHAQSPESAAQSVEDAQVNKLQARFDAGSATVNDMIADHKRQCEPLESIRDGAVEALRNSLHPVK